MKQSNGPVVAGNVGEQPVHPAILRSESGPLRSGLKFYNRNPVVAVEGASDEVENGGGWASQLCEPN